MLLRSSSTPILGSSLSSSSSFFFTESPTNYQRHSSERTSSSSLHSLSCRFNPLSSSSDHHHPTIFRRAQSDGNLHSLLSDHLGVSHHHPSLKTSCSGCSSAVRETIPSFSMYNSRQLVEEEEEEREQGVQDSLERSATLEENIRREFSFSGGKENMGLAKNAQEICGSTVSPLFLARGLGIDRVASGLFGGGGGCGGGGDGGSCSVLTGGGGERSDTEMYYRKMVEENPSNALFLRNYAQFLYETKGDPKRAEEYYSRAILAEPGDGEILSQYAKLVWELHHDEERASSYFEQAVQAAPNDSHILAAYAGFLWETDEDDGVGGTKENGPLSDYTGSPIPHGTLASASA